MSFRSRLFLAAITVAVPGIAAAAVGADEAKQLGGKLTLVGAEAAGNKEGTIPPYSGKAPKAPAGYDLKDPGLRPAPYNDKPLFSITAKNADKYADKLDQLVEMFKKYPNFRMDIYPSHRDFAYPKPVLDNTVKNATSCQAVQEELKLEGCYGGYPFPIPKTGNQVMWNHLTQYAAAAYQGRSESWVTPVSGQAVQQARTELFQQLDYYDPANTKPNPADVSFWKMRSTDLAPVRKVGGKLMLDDSLDMVGVGRRVYQYIPGQRRVKLAPSLAYDTPSPIAGGAQTMDDSKLFLGALDRFDFKLIGKKEKFIPYNNYSTANANVCPVERLVASQNFPQPDCMRWELHRVWVVEAKLKSEFRHVYAKRVFYFDEDAPGAGVAEAYDMGGKLYRVLLSASYPFYDNENGGFVDTTFALDLQTGIWSVQGLSASSAGSGGGFVSAARRDNRYFSPEALAGDGVR